MASGRRKTKQRIFAVLAVLVITTFSSNPEVIAYVTSVLEILLK